MNNITYKNIFLNVATVIIVTGCSSLPLNIDKPISFAYRNTENTLLGEAVAPLLKDKSSDTGVLPLISGVDAFTARYMLASAAERSIDVQYYIWHNDTTGKLLLYSIVEAANRGVRVRLLLDDINMAGKDEALIALNLHPNIEVRLFNPFVNRRWRAIDFITDFSRVNRRMHNKSFTIDNQLTIVGGRNIGDEYFDASPTVDFHDFDLLAVGRVVRDVSDQFDKYWNSDVAIPIDVLEKNNSAYTTEILKANLEGFFIESKNTPYVDAINRSELIKNVAQKELKFYWDEAILIYDEPEKVKLDSSDTSTHLISKIQPILNDVQNEAILISPYFIPGDEGMNRIKELSSRGVSIKVLTNSLASTDVPIVYSKYKSYRLPILQNNVELYEIKSIIKTKRKKGLLGSSSQSSLHSKIYVFDRNRIFVGSYNLDPRSKNINTEMGILVSNTEIARLLGEWWDKSINQVAYKLMIESVEGEYGKESHLVWYDLSTHPNKRYEEAPKASFWKILGSDLLSILPMEDQL